MENKIIADNIREWQKKKTAPLESLTNMESIITELKEKYKENRNKVIMDNIDVLIEVSQHIYVDCSDEMSPTSTECPRCFLIRSKQHGYIADKYDIKLIVKEK